MRLILTVIRAASLLHFARPAAAKATQAPLLPRPMHVLHLTHEVGVATFADWHAALDDQDVRRTLKRVVIHSAPSQLYKTRDHQTWATWEHEGTWPAFTNAIDRIKELANLEDLEISFSSSARGVENDDFTGIEPERWQTRRNTLQAVFHAMHERIRDKDPGFSRIRRLTIENLQNIPLPELTTSEPFKAVMADIQDLRLFIVTEYNEHGPDQDFMCIERWTFEPYLKEHWLATVAHQLKSLSLAFDVCWGTAPGYFNGEGLDFPLLKTLNLRELAISHHDHLDWVLRQTSLTRLRLHRCFIVSYLSFMYELETGKIPTHDWERVPVGAFGVDTGYDVWSFNGTWGDIFDKVRTSLVNLESFRVGYDRLATGAGFESISSGLSPERYITLETGTLPGQWSETGPDGYMDMTSGEWSAAMESEDYQEPNKAKEHAQRDGQALVRLQRAIEQAKADQLGSTVDLTV